MSGRSSRGRGGGRGGVQLNRSKVVVDISYCLVNALHLPWKLNTRTLWAAILNHVVRKRCSDISLTDSVSEVGVNKTSFLSCQLIQCTLLCFCRSLCFLLSAEVWLSLLSKQLAQPSLSRTTWLVWMMWPATPLFKRFVPARGHFPLEANSENFPCPLISV